MITYPQLKELHNQITTGKPVFSTRVQLNALDTIAMICGTGQFSYIELVEEYGSPLTIETINRACAVSSLPVIVKINRQNQESIAQNCITVGASGILFVEAESADDVRHCVSILRTASVDGNGLYGAKSTVFCPLPHAGSAAFPDSFKHLIIAVMIERVGAVEDIEEIVEIEGVSTLVLGATDLSLEMGHSGNPGHEDVQAALTRVRIAAKNSKKGISVRPEMQSFDAVKGYWEQGYRHFSVGTDAGTLRSYYNSIASSIVQLMEEQG
jgi:2-keto-3-deoxy-L-rhamnonate aldolase RhmA